MKAPAWYAQSVAKAGERVASGSVTQDEAVAGVVAEMGRHPEFLAMIAARDVSEQARLHGTASECAA